MSNHYKDHITEIVMIGVETASRILKIQYPEVYFNPHTDFLNPNVSSMYLESRKAIVFNDKWLESANELEILMTCFHEMRHAYQHFCIQSNSRENEDTINIWKSEFDGYNKPSSTNNPKNDELYLMQLIEVDAIAFAYHQMKELLDVDAIIPIVIKTLVERRILEIKGM